MIAHRSIFLLFATFAWAEAAHRFAPNPAVLKIRGGAGPLDPESTVKVVAALGTAQGVLLEVAPKLSLSQYGLDDNANDEFAQLAASQIGLFILYLTIMEFCTIFQRHLFQPRCRQATFSFCTTRCVTVSAERGSSRQ